MKSSSLINAKPVSIITESSHEQEWDEKWWRYSQTWKHREDCLRVPANSATQAEIVALLAEYE